MDSEGTAAWGGSREQRLQKRIPGSSSEAPDAKMHDKLEAWGILTSG